MTPLFFANKFGGLIFSTIFVEQPTKSRVMTFKEIKLNQEFRTSNGRPSVKISEDKAKSLVPVCVSASVNAYAEEVHFNVNPNDWVYLPSNA